MTTGFTVKQKAIILARDGHKCALCGSEAQTVNHRANRGAGGFRAANRLSNGCGICFRCNSDIESIPKVADCARALGVKISKYSDPKETLFLHPVEQVWVYLDDWGSFSFLDAGLSVSKPNGNPQPENEG